MCIWIRANRRYKIYFDEGNLNNKTIHVLAIIEDHVVYRHWSKYKQHWFYAVEHYSLFNLYKEKNYIKEVK